MLSVRFVSYSTCHWCTPITTGSLVGGLPVEARAGVFRWLLFCGFVGLRWGAGVTHLCVCLRWFPSLVPVCVY